MKMFDVHVTLFILLAFPIPTLSEEDKPYMCEVGAKRGRRFLIDTIVDAGAGIAKAVGGAIIGQDAANAIVDTVAGGIKSLLPCSGPASAFPGATAGTANAVGGAADLVQKQRAEAAAAEEKRKQAQREAEFNHISGEQREKVKEITTGQMEEMKRVSEEQDKKYEDLSRQQSEEVNKLAKQQAEQLKSLAADKEKNNKAALKLLEANQNQAKLDLENYEKITQQQNEEYEVTLKQANMLDDIQDAQAQQFLNLSAEQGKVYDLTLQQMDELEKLSKDQSQQVEKLSNQFEERSQKQTELVEGIATKIGNISEKMDEEFTDFSRQQTKHVEEVTEQLTQISEQQVEKFDQLGKQQEEIYSNLSKELKEIKVYADEEKRALQTVSTLVSEGFVSLQKQIDARFDRLERMLEALTEVTRFLDYESKVQKRLRAVHDAYLEFAKSMKNLTTGERNTVPLFHLIRKCCSNVPFEIMAALHQKTIGKSMQVYNMFDTIYESYFAVDSLRMVNLFEFIVNDLFKTIQMVQICDKVTNGNGIGMDSALEQFKELTEAIDKKTARLEAHSLEVLVDQSYVIGKVIQEFKAKTPPPSYPDDLGCGIDELTGEFAAFAAQDLKKRFHFYDFFVAVITRNTSELNKDDTLRDYEKDPDSWCKSKDSHFFKYTKKHSEEYEKNSNKIVPLSVSGGNITMVNFQDKYADEDIIILVAFSKEQKHGPNFNCLQKVKLNCPTVQDFNELPAAPTIPANGISCSIPYFVDVCGISSASFPFHVKECHRNPRPFMVSTCY